MLTRIKLLLAVCVFFMICTSCVADHPKQKAHKMAYQDILAKPTSGAQVKLVVIGNSIGCGQTANDVNGNPINTSTALISTQNGMYKKVVGTTSNGSANPNLTDTWPAKGWVNQLYTYLKGKNANNVLINESGSGWSTGDHLGGVDPSDGWTWCENTINKIVNSYTVKPDIVLVPLQVNDWGHGLGLAWFNTHYAQILDTLIAGLPSAAVVVVIESPVYNRSQVTSNPGNYNTDIVNESGAKNFYDSARAMAAARGLAVLDLNTPIDTLAKAVSGADYGTKLYNTGLMADGAPNFPIHPNQAGHDIMATTAISFFNSYQPPPPLAWVTQPTVVSSTDDGGIITYGTADPVADDVTVAGTSAATVAATATLRDASAALITAGVTASSVSLMVESLTVTAGVSTVISDTLQSVEAMRADIEAFPTVADLLTLASGITAPFAWSAQPALVSSTADGGVISYSTYDTGFDDVTTTTDVSVQVAELLAKVDNLLTTVEAVPSVADLLAQVENITTTAQADASAVDVKLAGVADSLLSAADAITEVTDLQLLVDNVTTMAESGVGTNEIAAYVDQAASAATVGVSVTDTLLGTFIGRYLMLNTCPPRIFSNTAPPRTFTNYCSPRGTA